MTWRAISFNFKSDARVASLGLENSRKINKRRMQHTRLTHDE